jgi:hypothetical protein
MRKLFGFLAKPSGLFSNAVFKGGCLFDAASLHGAAPFHQRKAGAQWAFSSQTLAKVSSVMHYNHHK